MLAKKGEFYIIKYMEKKIEKIIKEFNIEGKIDKFEVIHNGNINSTIFVSV